MMLIMMRWLRILWQQRHDDQPKSATWDTLEDISTSECVPFIGVDSPAQIGNSDITEVRGPDTSRLTSC